MNGSKRLPVEIRRWVISYAKKNYWRVVGFYDLDDLIQDGLMVAIKCRQKYGSDLDPPHFMSLVKTSFYNHIGALLRQKRGVYEHSSNFPDLAAKSSTTETDILDRILHGLEPIAETVVYLSELPTNIKKALSYFCSDEGVKEVFRTRIRLSDDAPPSEDTFMIRLNKLAGFPAEFDLETDLLSYFLPY